MISSGILFATAFRNRRCKMVKGRLKALIGAIILLGFYSGCEMYPTSPEPPEGGIEIVRLAPPEGAVVLSGPLYAEAWIEAEEGGEVTLSAQYMTWQIEHTVSVPAGALPQDTTVSISLPHPFLVLVELEPSNVNFNIPVEVELRYDGFDCGFMMQWSLGMFWWDEANQVWVPIDAEIEVGEDGLRVSFSVEHFSRYALARSD
jgi:hypothetical protein